VLVVALMERVVDPIPAGPIGGPWLVFGPGVRGTGHIAKAERQLHKSWPKVDLGDRGA